MILRYAVCETVGDLERGLRGDKNHTDSPRGTHYIEHNGTLLRYVPRILPPVQKATDTGELRLPV